MVTSESTVLPGASNENKGGNNKNEIQEYSIGYLSLNFYFKEFCLAKRKYFTANT